MTGERAEDGETTGSSVRSGVPSETPPAPPSSPGGGGESGPAPSSDSSTESGDRDALTRRELEQERRQLELDRRDLELERRELEQRKEQADQEQDDVQTIQIDPDEDTPLAEEEQPPEPEMITERKRQGVRWHTRQIPKA